MTPTFHHALVAIDQSQASDIIIDCLPHFHQLGTEKITLYTSVSVSYPGGLDQSSKKQYQDKLEAFKSKLENQLSDAGLAIRVETKAEFGINAYPPHEIINAAHELEASYIIIANRGYSKYRELLLGSTATELLQRCDLPVYLINMKMSDQHLYCVRACRDTLYHVFYPTDFSDNADRAFQALEHLLTQNTGRATRHITLYHVQSTGRIGMDQPDKLAEFNRIDRERLEALKERLQKVTEAQIHLDIGAGSAAHEITGKAAHSEASMIIMGGQGRGYIRDLFLGGVSHQVVRNVDIPVLIIPALRK
ncbi:universal stress protein [Natronogracilivirga saccharolytica]|uniref:Universal stress protein n=1 Tax=Natronogracilivirga saccharolytica TaxID=2812953 RepID=A0A8J7RT21_9BACT|nr:universal stress protein [Natronogracilivirga saccharolytica]MBP3193304.1 universal stress protein [Natronogracilivirga saccharolytica]